MTQWLLDRKGNFFIKCSIGHGALKELFLLQTVMDNTAFLCCFFYFKQRIILEILVEESVTNVQDFKI